MTASFDGKIITIFGGTGFVGRAIIAKLAAQGATIRVVTRTPQSAYFLKPYGRVGQISAACCDFKDIKSVEAALKDSYAVINCLGILCEKGKHTFQKIHVDCAYMIASAAKLKSVKKLVHISSLSCDHAKSKYALSKHEGEDKVRKAFPDAIILRPSLIFGADDNFFNLFAKLSVISPILPLINGGHTKFQPIYVGDVASAVQNVLLNGHNGAVYELGGPDIVSFENLMEKVNFYTGRNRMLLSIPTWAANIKASILSLLPNPPLTKDQIISLETDNVVSLNAKTVQDLNISPISMDAILPQYLDHYKSGGRFADKKRA